jgi:ATP phosphoribosyltransferase
MAVRIALTKGRLEKDTMALLRKSGIDTSAVDNKGRKLILPVGEDFEIVLAKSPDVLTYVEHGVCDIGIVGKDTILEHGGSFFEVLDLGLGKCRFAVAGLPGTDIYSGFLQKKIATKYPNIARRYFFERGLDVEIIKIEGSVELAPLLKLSDAIVDIVETGSTLKENGLIVLESFMEISARVIVNTAAMKMKTTQVEGFLDLIKSAL